MLDSSHSYITDLSARRSTGKAAEQPPTREKQAKTLRKFVGADEGEVIPHWVPAAAAVLIFALVDLLMIHLLPGAAPTLPVLFAAGVALASLPLVLLLIERQKAYMDRQLRHIATLHALDTAIAAEMELETVLEVAAREATQAVDGEQGGVVLLDSDGQIQEEAFFNTPESAREPLRRLLVSGADDPDVRLARVPVMRGTERYGYLGVIKSVPAAPFSEERRALLADLSATLLIAIKNARTLDEARRLSELKTLLREELDASQIEILERLAQAAEVRNDATGQHTRRVGRIAHLLSWPIGISDVDGELIKCAAPLHDVGKIGMRDTILMKPGKLTDSEYETMKQHTILGAQLLSNGHSELVQTAGRIALSHHERWDGSGYPHGLRGDEIPIEGRIVAVADVFDALTHERPYKAAWPVREAVEYIVSQSGSRFDPQVVDAFRLLPHETLL